MGGLMIFQTAGLMSVSPLERITEKIIIIFLWNNVLEFSHIYQNVKYIL